MNRITAAVMTAPGRSELRSLAPAEPGDGALLRVEACGVCAVDPVLYRRGDLAPAILGHEIVGRLVAAGAEAKRRWGLAEGARVVLDAPVPCRSCGFCARGEFRLCAAAQAEASGAIRYGATPLSVAPGLWGGFASHVYVHPRAVLHRIADAVPAAAATLAQVLADGVQAALDGGAGAGTRTLVLGCGTAGLCAGFAAGQAGSEVVLAGLAQEPRRRAAGAAFGLPVIDAQSGALQERLSAISDGRGADLVIDTTQDTSGQVAAAAIACAAMSATVVLGGTGTVGLPLGEMRRKNLTVRLLRGHSDAALTRALALLEAGHAALSGMCRESFGLEELDAALRASRGPDALHVTVVPP